MVYYNEFQWILVFFIYCFIGWIWETCYVSIRTHFFENRGFMSGPLLPIYGFGACIMLVSSMYVRDYPVLVFIFGLTSATALELVTGIFMEKLFRVKYWNYSHEKFNFKGYICLKSSLAWGVASLGLAYLIHRPIDALIMHIPEKILENIVMVISVIAAMDFATSFKAAMDLRDILIAAEKIRDEMVRLQKRAEIIETFVSDALKEKLTENKAVTALLKRNPGAVSKDHGITLNAYKELFLREISEIKEAIAKTQDKKTEV